MFTRKQGELAFASHSIPHTFANLSSADARVLIVCTSACSERYFDRIAARKAGVESPAEVLELWPEVIMFGLRISDRDLELRTDDDQRHYTH